MDLQMQDIADSKKGRLTVRMSLYESSILLPRVLPAFRQKYPAIEVIPMEGTYYQLEKLAIQDITDLTLATPPHSASPDLTPSPFLRRPF